MKLWQAYKYTYYWLYTWQKKLWGKNDLPEFTAIFGMTLSFGFVILCFDVINFLIMDYFIIPLNLSNVVYLIPMIILLLTHYFLFVHKGKYKQVEKEFKGESQAERKRKGFWVLLYTFGSIVLYGVLGFLGIWLRNNGYTPLIKYLGL